MLKIIIFNYQTSGPQPEEFSLPLEGYSDDKITRILLLK